MKEIIKKCEWEIEAFDRMSRKNCLELVDACKQLLETVESLKKENNQFKQAILDRVRVGE